MISLVRSITSGSDYEKRSSWPGPIGLTGVAGHVLGSVAWSGAAFAQGASNAKHEHWLRRARTAASASPNAASAAGVQANNSRGGGKGRWRPAAEGGGSSEWREGTNPGVRGGDPERGGPLQGLNDTELSFFASSKDVFMEVDAVPNGLGPRFNSRQLFPVAILSRRSGAAVLPPIRKWRLRRRPAPKNTLPSFITATGPAPRGALRT